MSYLIAPSKDVSVDGVDNDDGSPLIIPFNELCRAKIQQKGWSSEKCYANYLAEAKRQNLSNYPDAVMSKSSFIRFLFGNGYIGINSILVLAYAVFDEITADIYIKEMIKQYILPKCLDIASGKKSEKRRDDFNNMLKGKPNKSEWSADDNSYLVFTTSSKKDLVLMVKSNDKGDVCFKGRERGDKYDMEVEGNKCIPFIINGGRIRSTANGIPSTPYGLNSYSKKAGKIIGLVKIDFFTKKRVVIKGGDWNICD